VTCSNRVCLVEVREGHGFEYQGRTYCSLNCLSHTIYGGAR
jgi:hypothetical protein